MMMGSREISNNEKLRVPKEIFEELRNLEDMLDNKVDFQSEIYCILSSHVDPMLHALQLLLFLQKSNRKFNSINQLTRALVNSLTEWCNLHDMSNFLTLDLKINAFYSVMETGAITLISIVTELFRFMDHKQAFVPLLEKLLQEYKYKEAYAVIIACNWEQEFSLENLAFPLLFTGNDSMVYTYLSCSWNMQLEFVRTLDSICTKVDDIRNFIIRSLNLSIKQVKSVYLQTKTIQRRITSILDHFKIEIKNCPNMYHIRCAGAMRYITQKRFIEQSIEHEPWRELVLDTVADNLELKQELLIKLVCLNEASCALQIANDLNLDRKFWPAPLLNISHHVLKLEPKIEPLKLYDYLKLRLSASDIHFVHTPEVCIEIIDDITENYNVVGVDAEWKPDLGFSSTKASILQLAVWDDIYIIDLIELEKPLKSFLWDYLLQKIFLNNDIIKLGYGLSNDVNTITSTLSLTPLNQKKCSKLVDLNLIFSKVKIHCPEFSSEIHSWHPLSVNDPPELKGLSQLCRIVLGNALDKAEQFSDWEKRPLRETQITYAALDAFCLLMIYEKIFPLMQQMQLDFEKIEKLSSQPPSLSKSARRKSKQKSKVEPNITSNALPISEFKVIVDRNVIGAAKYLRLLGADVLILEEGEDKRKAIDACLNDNRIILTSGAAYTNFLTYVPQNMCYSLDHQMTAKDQVSAVLKHFNIHCQEKDIFSLCTDGASTSLFEQTVEFSNTDLEKNITVNTDLEKNVSANTDLEKIISANTDLEKNISHPCDKTPSNFSKDKQNKEKACSKNIQYFLGDESSDDDDMVFL